MLVLLIALVRFAVTVGLFIWAWADGVSWPVLLILGVLLLQFEVHGLSVAVQSHALRRLTDRTTRLTELLGDLSTATTQSHACLDQRIRSVGNQHIWASQTRTGNNAH